MLYLIGHNDLQRALSETRSFFANTMNSTNRTEPFGQYRGLPYDPLECISNNETFVTSPQVDFERFVQENLGISQNTIDTDLTKQCHNRPSNNEQQSLKKTSRACKGKRYLEFINTVKVTSVVKKTSRICSTSLKPQNTTTKAQMNNPTFDHMYASLPATLSHAPQYETTDQLNDHDSQTAKQFNAKDFDLDEKIKALVALDLDEYLSRKRDNKKKKKITPKKNNVGSQSINDEKGCSPQTIQDAKEQLRRSIVGSQKRKARKESITRRDIVTDTDPLITESVISCPKMLPEVATSDLFILAEVAAAVTN